MSTQPTIKELQAWSIKRCLEWFKALPPVEAVSLEGAYKGEYIGPRWLQLAAPRLMFLGGLQGWWGKKFDGRDGAINLVERDGKVQEVVPMILDDRPSRIDSRPTATLTYHKDAGPVARNLRDEFHRMPDGSLLGMSMARLRWGEKLPLPFVLKKS